MSFIEELKSNYPDLVGNINHSVVKGTILLSGNIYTASDSDKVRSFIKDKLIDMYGVYMFVDGLKIDSLSIISNQGSTNNSTPKNILDELEIIYQGMLPLNTIQMNNSFRDKNVILPENLKKIDNCVKVLNFISPIVLDSNLTIIDGNKRFILAEANGIKEVPVIIVDDCGDRAKALSLILNRSSEFQRWDFQEVDDFVDEHPQLQPILEPLGFFGRYVLPESFFSNTIVQYEIDPFNEKQKQYVQEEGLAEWAKYRREVMQRESDRRREIKKKKEDTSNTVSLFDLVPSKDDFLETYDIDKEVEDFNQKYKDLAENITQANDTEVKAKIKEKGGVWQTSSRTASQVAEDNRNKAIKFIEKSSEYTPEEKAMIIDNIEDFADIYKDTEAVKEMLRDEV